MWGLNSSITRASLSLGPCSFIYIKTSSTCLYQHQTHFTHHQTFRNPLIRCRKRVASVAKMLPENKKKGEKRKKNQGRAHKRLGAPLFSGALTQTDREGCTKKGFICPAPALLLLSLLLSTHSCAAVARE